MWASTCVLSEFIIRYYSRLTARGHVVSPSLSEMKQNCIVRRLFLRCALVCGRFDMRRTVRLVTACFYCYLIHIYTVYYTGTYFGICLYYFNIGLHCSSFCDLQMIANDVRKAEKSLIFSGNAFQSQYISHGIFCPSSRLSTSTFSAKNSSYKFARWRHSSICCLYSFLDEFLCVFVVF